MRADIAAARVLLYSRLGNCSRLQAGGVRPCEIFHLCRPAE